MGPFRLNDLVGSDIGLHVGKNFVEAFSERVRFRGGPGFKPRRRRLFSVALPPPRARVGALCLGIVTPGFLARVGRTDAIKGLLPPPVSPPARPHPPPHPPIPKYLQVYLSHLIPLLNEHKRLGEKTGKGFYKARRRGGGDFWDSVGVLRSSHWEVAGEGFEKARRGQAEATCGGGFRTARRGLRGPGCRGLGGLSVGGCRGLGGRVGR